MGNHPLASKPNYIFIGIAVLLIMLAAVLYEFTNAALSYEQARVFIEAISIVATLSLLYFAYVNVLSSRTKDIAAAELAVRPILIWKIAQEGKKSVFLYRTIKHPIYDLDVQLELAGKKLEIFERHLDVSEQNGDIHKNEKEKDITAFIRSSLGARDEGKMLITLSYHSEVGGRYEACFSKEIKAGAKGMQLLDRKILWADYPWRDEKVYFD